MDETIRMRCLTCITDFDYEYEYEEGMINADCPRCGAEYGIDVFRLDSEALVRGIQNRMCKPEQAENGQLTPDSEVQAYLDIFLWLTTGQTPPDIAIDTNMPEMTSQQAAAIIWMIEEGVKLGRNDIRMELCSRCEHLRPSDREYIGRCEKCKKYYCQDCDLGFDIETEICSDCSGAA